MRIRGGGAGERLCRFLCFSLSGVKVLGHARIIQTRWTCEIDVKKQPKPPSFLATTLVRFLYVVISTSCQALSLKLKASWTLCYFMSGYVIPLKYATQFV